jgi:ubiquinone/menaquinone biosynthesis C-methylase UbiE
MRFLNRILGYFFSLLYHNLAWGYDLVAAVVSWGRWKHWVGSVLPFITGSCVLELGHGPGHLQLQMANLEMLPVGLDESRQMGILARLKLRRNSYTLNNLVRGRSQALPFLSGSFDTVVATFPAEYIYDPQTITEVRRCLRIGGAFVFLPAAWITGKSTLDRFLAWLFRITGESPSDLVQILHERIEPVFLMAGLKLDFQKIFLKNSYVLIIRATTNN